MSENMTLHQYDTQRLQKDSNYLDNYYDRLYKIRNSKLNDDFKKVLFEAHFYVDEQMCSTKSRSLL